MDHRTGIALNSGISDQEFGLFQRFFQDQIGLQLTSVKKPLLCGRLAKRLTALGLDNYNAYYNLLVSKSGGEERETAIDLITTHETYFFREPKHFELLQSAVIPSMGSNSGLRVWSAASSTGEEAYTLAMVLDSFCAPKNWSITATDISRQVLQQAERGLYPMSRGERIPDYHLKRYCLRGGGPYKGYFLVQSELRRRVNFLPGNLTLPESRLGMFDVILLRNVLIYFDLPTKTRVLHNVLERLKPGGWLMVGHSESLHDIRLPLEMITPSVYRKVSI
ncbi:protein-glutamate O-methyltransferase CheR [Pseudomonas fluorescens]|uniref:Chemotaxis protein methyltransferase n=1 Tax=Pseudomonas fluorescens TaxID=294 RepID=A0A423LKC1_PSEFL|nr:protein-glutamate O-methyltransferase CheR [Pseudomonas fluorescens]RON68801.1 SAM-dependent methyltransferase [Pseudomonas fluorescens]